MKGTASPEAKDQIISSEWGKNSDLLENPLVYSETAVFWYGVQAFAKGGYVVKGKDAGNYLSHYLSNTGDKMNADFRRMTSESKIASQNRANDISDFISASKDLAIEGQKINIVSIQEEYYKNMDAYDSENWLLAVGSYRTWGEGSVTMSNGNIEASFSYNMRDVYDFHQYKEGEEQIVTNGKINFLKNIDLKELYWLGAACEFEIVGTENMAISLKNGKETIVTK